MNLRNTGTWKSHNSRELILTRYSKEVSKDVGDPHEEENAGVHHRNSKEEKISQKLETIGVLPEEEACRSEAAVLTSANHIEGGRTELTRVSCGPGQPLLQTGYMHCTHRTFRQIKMFMVYDAMVSILLFWGF